MVDRALTLEKLAAGGRIQKQSGDLFDRPAIEMNVDAGRTLGAEDNRHLAKGGREGIGGQFEALELAGYIQVVKFSWGGKQFFFIQQQWIEGQAAIFHGQADFGQPGQDNFLD